MTVRVVIVDDQELVREGFRLVLSREPDIDVVGEAGDGSEAVVVVEAAKPDVVLMDVRMPRVDGVAATERILAGPEPRPAVVILTTFDLDEYVYAALRAGATGFLLKDVRPVDLIHAVRVAAAGEAMLAASVTRRLLATFARQHAEPTPDPGADDLTAREVDVLMLIAQGKANAEIGKELFVSESTVKTHVSRILMKLGLKHRTQIAVYAYESGLVRPGAGEDQSKV